jgi:hypothetical protein
MASGLDYGLAIRASNSSNLVNIADYTSARLVAIYTGSGTSGTATISGFNSSQGVWVIIPNDGRGIPGSSFSGSTFTWTNASLAPGANLGDSYQSSADFTVYFYHTTSNTVEGNFGFAAFNSSGNIVIDDNRPVLTYRSSGNMTANGNTTSTNSNGSNNYAVGTIVYYNTPSLTDSETAFYPLGIGDYIVGGDIENAGSGAIGRVDADTSYIIAGPVSLNSTVQNSEGLAIFDANGNLTFDSGRTLGTVLAGVATTINQTGGSVQGSFTIPSATTHISQPAAVGQTLFTTVPQPTGFYQLVMLYRIDATTITYRATRFDTVPVAAPNNSSGTVTANILCADFSDV